MIKARATKQIGRGLLVTFKSKVKVTVTFSTKKAYNSAMLGPSNLLSSDMLVPTSR